MGDENPTGPECPTLPERLARGIRVPYPVLCLIIALLAGGPGSFVLFYLGSFSLEDAFRSTVVASVLSVSPVQARVSPLLGLLEIAESTLALFADLYLIGYLRHRIVAARAKLSLLTPEGSTTFDRAFRLVPSNAGPLGFALVFFALYFPPRIPLAVGPVAFTGLTLLTALAVGVYGAAFWVYLSALWGVAAFGREPLKLKSFLQDRMLGLRPLGQLVVSFAMIFSLAITLTLGGSLVAGDSGSIAINLVIVAGGVAMLFLPLMNTHRRMVEAKEEQEALIASRFKQVLSSASSSRPSEGQPDSPGKIGDLGELQTYLALRAEAAQISDWPFETRSVERVVAILLAILTVLLTRLLTL